MKPELSNYLYVSSVPIVTANKMGILSKRLPLMVTFGNQRSENYLVCGFHKIHPTMINGISDIQFFITLKMDVYKRTEGYEPRGDSFGPPIEPA